EPGGFRADAEDLLPRFGLRLARGLRRGRFSAALGMGRAATALVGRLAASPGVRLAPALGRRGLSALSFLVAALAALVPLDRGTNSEKARRNHDQQSKPAVQRHRNHQELLLRQYRAMPTIAATRQPTVIPTKPPIAAPASVPTMAGPRAQHNTIKRPALNAARRTVPGGLLPVVVGTARKIPSPVVAMRRKRAMSPPPLHPLEAEVMEELWSRGEAPVRAVLEALNGRSERPRAYTTIMTTMGRL